MANLKGVFGGHGRPRPAPVSGAGRPWYGVHASDRCALQLPVCAVQD